eukprot:1947283-Lingulodinium_polyedra.AAC.1
MATGWLRVAAGAGGRGRSQTRLGAYDSGEEGLAARAAAAAAPEPARANGFVSAEDGLGDGEAGPGSPPR